MARRVLLFSVLVVGSLCNATLVNGQSGKETTNADVVDMASKAGGSGAVIIEFFRQAQPSFEVSPTGLFSPKRAGVSDEVIAELQTAVQRATRSQQSIGLSTRGPLTRQAAAALLNRTKDVSEPFSVLVSLNRTCVQPMSDEEFLSRMQAEALDPTLAQTNSAATDAIRHLVSLHFVEIKKVQAQPGECKAAASDVLVTTLTASGETEAAAHWQRVRGGPSTENRWNVPVSRRQINEVTGIQLGDQQCTVEFTWRWAPIYGKPTVTGFYAAMPGTAIVNLYDDGWRVDAGGSSRFHFTFYDVSGRMSGRIDLGAVDAPSVEAKIAPAQPAVQSMPVIFTNSVMADDVDSNGDPVGLRDRFSSAVRNIACYFEVSGQRAGQVLEIAWVQPDLRERGRATKILSAPVRGKTSYFYFVLRPKAALPAGRWRVDVYVDGVLGKVLTFEVY